ncbi:MAG: hypothetical protein U1E29_17210, partial [Coriobacteriia bacterium]|nr:hypothetical protein [Coriobacteriia bacterium]
MNARGIALLMLSIGVLAVAGLSVGCATEVVDDEGIAEQVVEQSTESATERSAEPPATLAAEPENAPVVSGQVVRPSVSEAEEAVLRIALEQYPGIPTRSATVEGMGLDGQGRWWIQAWTSAGPEYEGEQWFVTFDGKSWLYQDSGTGMWRTDYP